MTIVRDGEYWRGADDANLAEYLRESGAGGYAVVDVAVAVCAECDGRVFHVLADDVEGCVQRTCVKCESAAYVADSEDALAEADLWVCECPCGGETFAVAVGFARRDDGEIRWVSVGVRCLDDGLLGVCADWKIDYSPSVHLLNRA